MFILLVGCTRQRDTLSVQSNNSEPTLTGDNFEFTIGDGQIGNLKTGEQLTDVLEKLKTFMVALAQKVLRETTGRENDRVQRLIDLASLFS